MSLAALEPWLTPPVLLTVLLLLFSFAWRSGRLGRRLVTGTLIVAGMALAFRLLNGQVGALTSAQTWPVAILILASLVMIATLERTAPEAAADPATGFSVAEHLGGGVALVVLGLAVWLVDAPHGELADPLSPPPVARTPWFLLGLQELGHYFQPWAAGWLWSAVALLAFLALPFLDGEAPVDDTAPGLSETVPGRHPMIAVILFIWLVLGLYPMAVGAWLCRGPGVPEPALATPIWGEGAAWPLSEMLWNRWLAIGSPERWWLRELPGLLILGLYFVVLPLQLPRWKSTRGVFSRARQKLGGPRYWLVAVLLLLILLPPLKMYARWLFDLGPLIDLPELGLGL